jgi:hypothetical protein
MQSQQNHTLAIQTADSAYLSMALNNMTNTLWDAAERSITEAIGDGEGYTALERRAMIAAEALRLTHGFDLTAIITRGQIIRQIEEEGLTSVHPNGFADLTALAREQGISVSELSDTRALCDVIFPYITNVLGRSIAEVWAEIGKSSMRELVPALRSIITGEDASHNTVREAVTTLLNNAAAELMAGGIQQDELTVDEVRRNAVEFLLTQGATLPTRELRRTVRPTRTPPVDAATLITGEAEWHVVIQITSQDQYDMIMRQLGSHANNMVLDGRSASTRDHVRILRSFFGGNA